MHEGEETQQSVVVAIEEAFFVWLMLGIPEMTDEFPTLLTISLPFTRFGRNGLTTDVPSSGRSVLRKAVSSCISVSMDLV
jgi:hypothetical protein